MQLSQILFNTAVFDPKTTRGADNTRSFYTVKDGYTIELDPASGIVKISHASGRHNCVHCSTAKEWRELEDTPAISLKPQEPKFVMVQSAEGAYVMKPIAKPEPEPEAAEPEIAIPPRKRGPGRPKKVPTSE